MNGKFLPIALFLIGMCVSSTSDAQQTHSIISKAKYDSNESVTTAAASGDAMYAMPAALSNLGTHTADNKPVCNYLARHKDINGGAFLWAPYDTPVLYLDQSTGNPSAWNWTIPGATVETQTTQNAEARYASEGLFAMPTLSVTTATGTSSYTPAMSMTSAGGSEMIKVGGTAEITTADMRVSAQMYDPTTGIGHPSNATCALGAMTYDSNGGYVGGSNNRGVVGWGNLFMFGHDELELVGVNVYFHHKPTKYADNAKVTLNVWWPLITESAIYLTQNPNTGGYPLESAYINYSDIKADGEGGAWSFTYDGAVANITFPNPIDLYGKPYIFISVDGFSQDPANDDLCLMADIKGPMLNEVQQANMLAHNSFGRYNGENEYNRPISSYGGGNGSFMICPVVRSYHSPAAIDNITADADAFKARFEGAQLVVESATDDILSLYDLSGKLVMQQAISEGTTAIAADAIASGLYIAKTTQGNAVKIAK